MPAMENVLLLFPDMQDLVHTDIVTPPAISNIGSCAGKIRLEIQGLPGYDTVTGEAYRISV